MATTASHGLACDPMEDAFFSENTKMINQNCAYCMILSKLWFLLSRSKLLDKYDYYLGISDCYWLKKYNYMFVLSYLT